MNWFKYKSRKNNHDVYINLKYVTAFNSTTGRVAFSDGSQSDLPTDADAERLARVLNHAAAVAALSAETPLGM